MARFTHGLSDDYLGGSDQSVMEGAFRAGMLQQQGTQQGSKMDGERVTRMQGAGLSQPVGRGTTVRSKPAGR